MGTYILSDTPSGIKTLIYSNRKEVRLHSAYHPLREAERSVDAFQKGRANLIVVCGLALAYHIAALRKRFPRCHVIVIERDAEVIDLARATVPDQIAGIPIISSESDIVPLFETMDLTAFTGIANYHHRPSYALDAPFYDALTRDINQYLSSKLSDLLTRFEFEERWIENIFSNLPILLVTPTVSQLFGKFQGYPGIIVSAGPSLRTNVALLRHLEDRSLLVSVDTALKVLQKNGISPHMVMTLDSQRYSIKHFLGLRDHQPVLLADMVSYPRIHDLYTGTVVMSTTSKYYTDSAGALRRETIPLIEWIEEHTEPIGDIQSGGSVATSAFDLLLNLGCNPIILIGQDLAYTGREIHCSGTYHNEEWVPAITRFKNLDTINQGVIRKRRISFVQAYGGEGTVPSDFIFDLYRGWFADSAKRVPVTVINATEGGARINHTVEKPLRELIESLPRQKREPRTILSEHLSERVSSIDAIYQSITTAIDEMSSVKARSEELLHLDDEHIESMDDVLTESSARFLSSFLKRTGVYLARHADLSPGRARTLLLNDIITASQRMTNILTKCKENLQNLR